MINTHGHGKRHENRNCNYLSKPVSSCCKNSRAYHYEGQQREHPCRNCAADTAYEHLKEAQLFVRRTEHKSKADDDGQCAHGLGTIKKQSKELAGRHDFLTYVKQRRYCSSRKNSVNKIIAVKHGDDYQRPYRDNCVKRAGM